MVGLLAAIEGKLGSILNVVIEWQAEKLAFNCSSSKQKRHGRFFLTVVTLHIDCWPEGCDESMQQVNLKCLFVCLSGIHSETSGSHDLRILGITLT
jgi:hypothetical protein